MTDPIELTPLDRHFADFIVRLHGASCTELWWGAALASNAVGTGHSCLLLDDLTDYCCAPCHHAPAPLPSSTAAQWRTVLERSRCVGSPGTYTPLILDSAGRLYLQRSWSYEQRIATAIALRRQEASTSTGHLSEALDRYFPSQDSREDLQRSAAAMALSQPFSVISGGPGTGKTATVARILALLLHLTENTPPRIMLAAPTGKAAMRLQQSILQAVSRLALPDSISSHLPSEVSTLHRLLGVRPQSGTFRHTPDNPLPCDILVIDEASMVDLHMMAAVLEALPLQCRVILLGDRNQLASVEAGAVLADICDGAEAAGVPVTQLTKSYRFTGDSGIAELSRLINSGDSSAVLELLRSGRCPDLSWQPLPPRSAFNAAFTATMRSAYADSFAARSPEAALAALNCFKVLTPLRSGPHGSLTLNQLCSSIRSTTAPQPIMITGNNYELELFNGDTGVILTGADSDAAWFERADGTLRTLSIFRLPPHEAAYALTVHKSQGSEYDRVLLILPDQLSPLLSRELLYTAATRARHHFELWGSEEVIRQAVEQRTRRISGLTAQLTEASRHV